MIRITLLGAVLLFAGLGGNQTAIAASSVEVPIEVHEGHVYVNVVVNGSQPLSFLVDSGAAVSAELIDKGVAEKLGLQGEDERTTPAIGGNVRVSFSRPVTLRIGSLEIPPAKLALLSLSDNDEAEGHKVDGILGFPFFAAFNPEIDYKNQKMRLSTSLSVKNDRYAISCELVEKLCRINAEIVLTPGQPAEHIKLIVDTGYDGSLMLNTPFVEKHNLLKSAGEAISGSSLGGKTEGATRRIPSLLIGTHATRQFDARLSTDKQGAFSTSDVDGYVGAEILKHYLVLFDYSHQRLVMRPQD